MLYVCSIEVRTIAEYRALRVRSGGWSYVCSIEVRNIAEYRALRVRSGGWSCKTIKSRQHFFASVNVDNKPCSCD
jgi:hypothetical protein